LASSGSTTDRVHDLHALVTVGAVGAELAALTGVEAALEERAEDRGSIWLKSSRMALIRSAVSARSSSSAAPSKRPPLNHSTE
jgi:hypothetical protein